MKNVLLALLLTNCATLPRDEIANDLPKYTRECYCELFRPDQEVSTVAWKDKALLKKQVKYCKCAILIKDFENDIVDPLDYMKPGTVFFAPQKLYPWEEDFRGSLKKVN